MAAERGHVDVMKVLIEGGADVNTQNKVIMYVGAYITPSLGSRPSPLCAF